MLTVYCKAIVYHGVMEENRTGIRDLRENLGRRVDAAHFKGEATVVEKNGEPRAVLVPYDWWLQVTASTGRDADGSPAGVPEEESPAEPV